MGINFIIQMPFLLPGAYSGKYGKHATKLHCMVISQFNLDYNKYILVPPKDELLNKLPLILIILLAVLIYFALVIICCLLVALFRRRYKYRGATKNAGGEFQLTPPKRSPNLHQPATHQLALYETERDSGISDHR